jgi:glycosyltransferase involved in cell wall biosynthesis
VLVAIPSYLCAQQVTRVLSDFSPALLERIEKVIVLDNCSSDDTVAVVRKLLPQLPSPEKFELIVNDRNRGLGGSQKVAFALAQKLRMDYVAILHGDDQAKTEELSLLLDEAVRHPSLSAILGARFMRRSKRENYSALRVVGNMGLNFLYTLLSLRFTADLGSGLNLFRVGDLQALDFQNFSDGFTFNMDLLLDLYRRRAPLRFVPITWREIDQVSNANTWKVGWITLTTLLRWRFKIPKRPQWSAPNL